VSLRKLLAVLAAALLMILGPAGLASAQEGETGQTEEGTEEGGEPEISHEAEECIHILEDGGDVDECQEAPNPILPATDELIWGVLSFVVLLFLLWKFALPPLKQGMEGRAERIRESLETAERAKVEAESVRDDYQRQLADARNESARIIEEARQTADQLRRDLQQRAEADIAELRQRAADEIQASKDRALAEVRVQVAEIAIGAAERVVQRSLDDATNRALVDSFIDQVGAGNGSAR
jgi:F-type H+-transporting ATPase subunit b